MDIHGEPKDSGAVAGGEGYAAGRPIRADDHVAPRHWEACVEAFQTRIGAPVGARLALDPKEPFDISTIEANAHEEIATEAYRLGMMHRDLKASYARTKDLRLMRAQLMAEELQETLLALGNRDEVALADALADLMYVVVGTATAYGIPLWAAFDEVHASNMTKQMRNDDHAFGRKGKGEGYRAPDIAAAIKRGRQ